MSEQDISDIERDYYLGNYQACINKASSLPTEPESIFYMCLSYCYLKKYDSLKSKLSKWDHKASEFVQIFADYSRNQIDKDEVIDHLDTITDEIDTDDELSRLVAANIYTTCGEYAKGLKLIDRLDSLVSTYTKILILIKMNRGDLAEKKLVMMSKQDDRSPITELAHAQVYIVTGQPDPAWRLANSLADRYKATPMLYNLQTTAAISLGEYDQAKQLCENSLDMDNELNPEALINMVHVMTKLKSNPESLKKNWTRLVEMYPDHHLVQECRRIGEELGVN